MLKTMDEKKNVGDVVGNDVFFSFKMAPRKIKTQDKRDGVKIKSKSSDGKRAIKALKKDKKHENSTENLNWLNKIPENGTYEGREPDWIHDGTYKLKMNDIVSATNVSESEQYPAQVEEEEEDEEEEEEEDDEDEKYTESDSSDECNCDFTQTVKNRNLKQKSSSNSVVDNYIKSGMDQVASFIVESAIRFGEQHGVVVPDKNNPNLYEFTPTDKKFGEKFRKIRFKIPEKSLGRKEGKRRGGKTPKMTPTRATTCSKTSWQEDRSDSIEKILPILKKIKQKNDFAKDEMNMENRRSDSEETCDDRSEERLKGWFRKHGKRHKSMESVVDALSEKEFSAKGPKWRKFRRDSLELGRQRLKAATVLRNQDSTATKSP